LVKIEQHNLAGRSCYYLFKENLKLELEERFKVEEQNVEFSTNPART